MPYRLLFPMAFLAVLLLFNLPAYAQLVFLEGDQDWLRKGQLENLVPTNRGLQLAKTLTGFEKEGSFISDIITTEVPFTHLVASWNAITPKGTYVIIEADVKIAQQQFTGWQVLGIWGTTIESNSITYSHWVNGYPFKIDIDIFQVLHSQGANQYRLRTQLVGDGEASPLLTGLGAVTYGGEREPLSWGPMDLDLPVPPRSQMVEDQSIRSRICSPVSLAMILEYYGHQEPSASVASGVYDHGARIYGNWSFNVAYAGSLGFKAYVDYYHSLEKVKRQINRGIPVVASIRFQEGELQNAPMSSTAGHLVLITGFTIDGVGREWVLVNDPAAPDGDTVKRRYLYQEFQEAWIGIVYIVEDKGSGYKELPRKPRGLHRQRCMFGGMQDMEIKLPIQTQKSLL